MVRAERTPRRLVEPGWVRVLDLSLDAGVVAFACWTLIYFVALAGQWSLWPAVAVWLPLTIVLSAAWIWRVCRNERSAPAPASLPAAEPQPRFWIGTLAGSCLITVAVIGRERWGIAPIAASTLATLVFSLWSHRRSWPVATSTSSSPVDVDADADAERPEAGQSWGSVSHLVAFAVSAGLACIGSLLLRYDADDAYYVNRATWVAQHGYPAINDTMFSPGTLPSIYPGLPLASIESLQGALAHLFGVQGATVAYVLMPPVLCFAFGWVTWRVIRAWARQRALLAFVVAISFVLLSAATVVGNYSLGRIWQGKVTAFAILLPLVWFYWGRLLARGDAELRRNLLLLVAAGTSFVGLTSSAALMAPVLGGAALLAGLLGRSRALILGAIGFLVPPLVSGVAVALSAGQVGEAQPLMPAEGAFSILFGAGVLMALPGLLGIALGPMGMPPAVRGLAMCGGLAIMTALLPGVFGLVDMVTGAGPVVWRLLIVVPIWILVGLLVAIPPGPDSQAAARSYVNTGGIAATATALVLIAVMLRAGTPLWSADVAAQLADRPTWKVPQQANSDVRALAARHTQPGLWLLPPQHMEVLSIGTTDHQAVIPRGFYLSGLRVKGAPMDNRNYLLGFVRGVPAEPDLVKASMEALHVSVACVAARSPRQRAVLTRVVGEPLERVGSLRCHFGTV